MATDEQRALWAAEATALDSTELFWREQLDALRLEMFPDIQEVEMTNGQRTILEREFNHRCAPFGLEFLFSDERVDLSRRV